MKFKKPDLSIPWKQASVFIICIVVAFTGKAMIGSEPPSAVNGKIQNFLVGTLAPTQVPEEIIKLQSKEIELMESEQDREYLRSELSSRGDIVDREKARKEMIIKAINNNIGGKLKGKGEVIYKASVTNKFPPFLQAAIIIHETGAGTSKAVRDRNNVGGIFKGSSLKYYNSVDDSIYDMATRIKKYYIDEGKTTLESFGAKYCPIGASNDPTQLNKHWIPSVHKNYIKLLNESGGIL